MTPDEAVSFLAFVKPFSDDNRQKHKDAIDVLRELVAGLLDGFPTETRFTVVFDPQGAWLWRHDPLSGGGYRSERLLLLAANEEAA